MLELIKGYSSFLVLDALPQAWEAFEIVERASGARLSAELFSEESQRQQLQATRGSGALVQKTRAKEEKGLRKNV